MTRAATIQRYEEAGVSNWEIYDIAPNSELPACPRCGIGKINPDDLQGVRTYNEGDMNQITQIGSCPHCGASVTLLYAIDIAFIGEPA